MGSIFPRKSRKTGKVISYRVKWYDENGDRQYRTVPKDKALAEALLLREESRVAAIKAGLLDRVVEAHREHQSRPLDEHLADFIQSMRDKRRTEKHIGGTERHCSRVILIMKATRLADLTLAGVEKALGEISRTKLRRTKPGKVRVVEGEANSNATRNRYRAAICAFSAWLHLTGRLPSDPLRAVESLEEEATTCRERRTLGAEDYRRLIWAAAVAPPWRKISGTDRALVYLLAGATGFRHDEIRSLKVSNFRLSEEPAAIHLAGRSTKNKKKSGQPIPRSLADELAARLAGKKPGEAAFRLPYGTGAEMLRFDLERCEPPIPYQDEQGRYYDFHSIRQETATLLFASGADIGVVRKVMRHSSVALTSRYTNPIDAAVAQAVSAVALPGLPRPAEPERGPPGSAAGSDVPSAWSEASVEHDDPAACKSVIPRFESGRRLSRQPGQKYAGSAPEGGSVDLVNVRPGERQCAPGCPNDCRRGAPGAPQDPDLSRLIESWPALPDRIRSAIMALVEIANPKPPDG